MPGPCDCPPGVGCGCFFETSSDVVATGSGAIDNPMVLALAPGLAPIKVCTSTSRPDPGYEGQPIYETDTKLFRIKQGSYWVCPYPRHRELDFPQVNVTADGGWHTFANWALEAPIDYPFRMTVHVDFHFAGSGDSNLSMAIDSPSGTGLTRGLPIGLFNWVPYIGGGPRYGQSSAMGWRDFVAGGTPMFVLRELVGGAAGLPVVIGAVCDVRVEPIPGLNGGGL